MINIRRFGFAILLGYFSLANQTVTANTLIEVRLADNTTSVVGQKRVLWVDILTDTWFAGAPTIPNIKIAGAVVLATQDFAINSTQLKGGKKYATQRREYLVYPQRTGNFHITSMTVIAKVAGNNGNITAITLESSPINFDVTVIPGSVSENLNLVAEDVVIKQKYSEIPSPLKVGDGVVRYVTAHAQDTPGMLIPSFQGMNGSLDVKNTRFYQHAPAISEHVNRGNYQGIRTETHTYVFTVAGPITLPGLHIRWWDPTKKSWIRSSLPPRTLNVFSGDTETLPTTRQIYAIRIASIFLTTLVFATFIWNYRKNILNSPLENSYRLLLRASCRGDCKHIIRYWYAWQIELAEKARVEPPPILNRVLMKFYDLQNVNPKITIAERIKLINAIKNTKKICNSEKLIFARSNLLVQLNPSK
jgi:hypothetical protein